MCGASEAAAHFECLSTCSSFSRKKILVLHGQRDCWSQLRMAHSLSLVDPNNCFVRLGWGTVLVLLYWNGTLLMLMLWWKWVLLVLTKGPRCPAHVIDKVFYRTKLGVEYMQIAIDIHVIAVCNIIFKNIRKNSRSSFFRWRETTMHVKGAWRQRLKAVECTNGARFFA